MTKKYVAVLPTRSLDNLKFTGEYLIEHSYHLYRLIVMWNNSEQFEEAKTWATRMIMKHPHIDVEVIDAHEMGVYEMFNRGVGYCPDDGYALLVNDDMYFPLAWDCLLNLVEEAFDPQVCVVSFLVVEPGYVDVNTKNIHKDFGMTLETFNKTGFDNWVEGEHVVMTQNQLGWYMPVLFPVRLFRKHGGYPTEPEFPYPNDVIFFQKVAKDNEVKFVNLSSPVYHFQRLSQRIENNEFPDKIHLGCGPVIMDGYLNVDVESSPGVYSYDLSKFPWAAFRNDYFSEAFCAHTIEHFSLYDAKLFLREVHRILKPDGRLFLYAPEIKLAFEDYLLGYHQRPDCAPPERRIYGQTPDGSHFPLAQIHKYGYTAELDRPNNIIELLRDAGFREVNKITPRFVDEWGVEAIK